MSGRDDLSALLGSRICHDLVSPLGAIGNGVELLAMSGLDAAPELALITESVGNANARIRFFRVAFGATGKERALARPRSGRSWATSRAGRIRVDWAIDGDVPRAEAKLAFLLVLCLESALPSGGGSRWRRRTTGGSSRASPTGPGRPRALGPSPRRRGRGRAQFGHGPLRACPDLARRLGRTVRTTLGETAVTISF
jgi:histidine phosphotransferase ChpT